MNRRAEPRTHHENRTADRSVASRPSRSLTRLSWVCRRNSIEVLWKCKKVTPAAPASSPSERTRSTTAPGAVSQYVISAASPVDVFLTTIPLSIGSAIDAIPWWTIIRSPVSTMNCAKSKSARLRRFRIRSRSCKMTSSHARSPRRKRSNFSRQLYTSRETKWTLCRYKRLRHSPRSKASRLRRSTSRMASSSRLTS